MNSLLLLILSVLVWLGGAPALAQVSGRPLSPPAVQPGVDQWLMQLHAASRRRAYAGTFVVTSGELMSSSRIWHVCDGQQQVERVEALTGEPRSTFRRNDQVVTFLPISRVAIQERRESLGLFPDLLRQADGSVARYYRLNIIGHDRVAGLQADIAQLTPLDALRFAYKIWTEQKTGLVIKLQTMDSGHAVLEQAAFSELQLNAPVQMARLMAQMDNTPGYRVRQARLVNTTAEQEGWLQKAPVPGFRPMSCNKRADASLVGGNGTTLQCVFSDGLASVSLFIEPFDAARHTAARQAAPPAMGATHVLVQKIGDWWLTAVGEVPMQTLVLFAQGLERKK